MAKHLKMAKKMAGKGENGFIDLGESNNGRELPAKAAKKWYPSMHMKIAGMEKNLGTMGMGMIKYKVRSITLKNDELPYVTLDMHSFKKVE